MFHQRRAAVLPLALALIASACGTAPAAKPEPSAAATSAPAPSAAPAYVACVDCWPFNGQPLMGGQATRKPLLIKIDNAPAARPHYAINQADMVFEIIVEGGVTRLAAVFHSQDPATIGGVRSARLADRSLTPMFRAALVYSGTSAHAWSLISKDAEQGKYVELSADHSSGYYRVPFRSAPYNLFTSAAAQRQSLKALGAESVTDIPRWSFLAASEHPATAGGMAGASAATELTIPYRADTSLVSYQYDATARTYARSQNTAGKPIRDIDAVNNQPIAATNVVIIRTEIWDVPEIVDASGALSNDMRLVGTGAATIYRDGLRQDGTWSRADDAAPFTFRNAAGDEILLSPGQSWIHVVSTDMQVESR